MYWNKIKTNYKLITKNNLWFSFIDGSVLIKMISYSYHLGQGQSKASWVHHCSTLWPITWTILTVLGEDTSLFKSRMRKRPCTLKEHIISDVSHRIIENHRKYTPKWPEAIKQTNKKRVWAEIMIKRLKLNWFKLFFFFNRLHHLVRKKQHGSIMLPCITSFSIKLCRELFSHWGPFHSSVYTSRLCDALISSMVATIAKRKYQMWY